jgi:opacity protein-like surface antigen
VRGRFTLAVACLFVAVAPAVAASAAEPASSVALFSKRGDFIGGGLQRFFDSGTATIGIQGPPGYVTVRAEQPASSQWFYFVFAPPPGEQLAPGIYADAQRAPFREPGHPGIDIVGDGKGCNQQAGTFEVKDIGVDASGNVSRLWVTYEQHCEGKPAPLFGEVRVGEPPTGANLWVTPSQARWPALSAGELGPTVPFEVVNTTASPRKITGASVQGSPQATFATRWDDCADVTLAAGQRCRVWVSARAVAAGVPSAQLAVTDQPGVAEDVYPDDEPGHTELSMESDPGEHVGQGEDWSYTPENATIEARGNANHVWLTVTGADGVYWSANFEPEAGDIMSPGDVFDGTGWPDNGNGVGINVSGDGRGCTTLDGSFLVTDADFEADGSLKRFGVVFVQHCDGAEEGLYGSFEYRSRAEPGEEPDPVTPPTPTPTPTSTKPLKPPPANPPKPASATVVKCGTRRITTRLLHRGTAHGELIRGSAAADVLLGRAGNDRLEGRGSGDCLDGGPGRDRIYGGDGDDRLYGGAGRDVLIGGRGQDSFDCGPGKDIAYVARGERYRRCEQIIKPRAHKR